MMYRKLIDELYSRRTKGIKLGLERVLSVLEKLGNPQNSFSSIHVAGTNGKGSVSKIIYCLLKSHGLKVGLFTSPHLIRFSERIVVDDREIEEEKVVRLIEKIKPYGEELTFFEYITVMAFLYFKEKDVDYAVLETGMGGRLDATNVVRPAISVITRIGLDHQQYLGSNLSRIAAEKAGIIKDKVPVICSFQEKEAEEVIKKKAEEKGSELFIYGRDFRGELNSINFDGLLFDYIDSKLKLNLSLSLTGVHQVENASVALKAFMTVFPNYYEFKIKEALRNVKMPGRLEVISKEPLVMLDIAHNPQAIKAVVDTLKILTEKKPIVVFGIMEDKDLNGFLRQLDGYAEQIIFTTPHYERALKYEELKRRINGLSSKINYEENLMEAFIKALTLCRENTHRFLLCTGSAYLIGELKEKLGEKSFHRTLGELL